MSDAGPSSPRDRSDDGDVRRTCAPGSGADLGSVRVHLREAPLAGVVRHVDAGCDPAQSTSSRPVSVRAVNAAVPRVASARATPTSAPVIAAAAMTSPSR